MKNATKTATRQGCSRQRKVERRDVHQQVTDNIIAAIEADADEWQMSWHRSGKGLNRPVNIDTRAHYRGVNILNLWVAGEVRGYTEGVWGTYRQWQNRGCQVSKGEKGSLAVFYKELEFEDQDAGTGMTSTETRLMAQASKVFNAEQGDGYEREPLPMPENPATPIEQAEAFVAASNALVRHGGGRAYYNPNQDSIQMPEHECFLGTNTSSSTEAYCGTRPRMLTNLRLPLRQPLAYFFPRSGTLMINLL